MARNTTSSSSSKKTVSLFDTTPETTTPETPETTPETTLETTPETTPETAKLFDDDAEKDEALAMHALSNLLCVSDESVVSKTSKVVEETTQRLIAFCKANLKESIEALSASMSTGSLMTQDQAAASIMSLLEGKVGYDKLEAQVYICRYCEMLCRINELIRTGMKAYLAIAVACHEKGVKCLPSNVRTLFNACIVYQKRDDKGIMQWVFWTPVDRTRNAIATHAIAQGCFIRSAGVEYLFTAELPTVQIETKKAVSVTGEKVTKPVIFYQWDEKSQRVLSFWNYLKVNKKTWHESLARFDGDAKQHIVDFEAREVEKAAKASVSTDIKGLETTKKAPNAVKVRNAKLKQLFAEMDF